MPKKEMNTLESIRNGSGAATESVARRRSPRYFSPAEKMRILEQVKACTGRGEVGALLRQEGIYSSTLTKWRKQFEDGGKQGLDQQRRGPKVKITADQRRVMELEKTVRRLETKLETTYKLLDLQKKVSALFGMDLQGREDIL